MYDQTIQDNFPEESKEDPLVQAVPGIEISEEVLIVGQRDSTDAVEAASKLDARLKSITGTDLYQWSFSKGIMFSNITRLHSCYVEQLLTVAR